MRTLLVILMFVALNAGAQHYPIKNMLGVNVHQWDIWYYDYDDYKGSYDAKYKAVVDLKPSSIRLYLDADGEKDSFGRYGFNPSYSGGFEPETGAKRIKQSNPEIFIQACYQRQPLPISIEWTKAGISSHLNFPYKYNNSIDRLKPSTYSSVSHDLAIITTRGGRNANGQNYDVIKNAWPPINEVVKGGGFYDAVEGGNEWNAWWGGFNTNLNSKELAAAWKPMYDSVKATDATMLFTNGGIAADNPDTFLRAIEWWKQYGYSIPVDYFSYHSYPSAEGLFGWPNSGGLPPEYLQYPRAKEMVAAVGQYKPVVIGEWGFDVHPNSPQNAPAFGSYTAEQTRGNWAVRDVLKFSQAGIWRAQWYRAYQDWPNSFWDGIDQQYATMALLRQYNDSGNVIKRTLVGDYFKQLNLFGDYVFDAATREDSLQVLRFKNGTNYVYALWSVETYKMINNRPVVTERKFNFNFTTGGTRYDLNEDSSGVMKSKPFYGGNVELSSKPFFIVTTTILPIKDKPHPTPKPKKFFDVYVNDIFGNVLRTGRTDDIENFRAELNRSGLANGFYILHFENKHEKFIKL